MAFFLLFNIEKLSAGQQSVELTIKYEPAALLKLHVNGGQRSVNVRVWCQV